jgi:hypothetical protein
VTLAAKVESKKGTNAITAAPAINFDLYLPLPPKREFTRPLKGEFRFIDMQNSFL